MDTLESAAKRLAQLSGKPIRLFATRDFGREHYTSARSVVVQSAKAVPLVYQLRSELEHGLLVFVGCTRSLAAGAKSGSEVVVATGESQMEILRVAKSDAVNYGMETEDLILKLQEYDQRYGIDIFHAETDTVEFSFKQVPQDLNRFCDDLYEFCPDIVDQGVGSVDKLAAQIVKQKSVYLWWD